MQKADNYQTTYRGLKISCLATKHNTKGVFYSMNFKKFKRLASAVLSFSMLLSMNAPVFATDMNTIAEAEKGNVSVLSELAARAGSATHKQCTRTARLRKARI